LQEDAAAEGLAVSTGQTAEKLRRYRGRNDTAVPLGGRSRPERSAQNGQRRAAHHEDVATRPQATAATAAATGAGKVAAVSGADAAAAAVPPVGGAIAAVAAEASAAARKTAGEATITAVAADRRVIGEVDIVQRDIRGRRVVGRIVGDEQPATEPGAAAAT